MNWFQERKIKVNVWYNFPGDNMAENSWQYPAMNWHQEKKMMVFDTIFLFFGVIVAL